MYSYHMPASGSPVDTVQGSDSIRESWAWISTCSNVAERLKLSLHYFYKILFKAQTLCSSTISISAWLQTPIFCLIIAQKAGCHFNYLLNVRQIGQRLSNHFTFGVNENVQNCGFNASFLSFQNYWSQSGFSIPNLNTSGNGSPGLVMLFLIQIPLRHPEIGVFMQATSHAKIIGQNVVFPAQFLNTSGHCSPSLAMIFLSWITCRHHTLSEKLVQLICLRHPLFLLWCLLRICTSDDSSGAHLYIKTAWHHVKASSYEIRWI